MGNFRLFWIASAAAAMLLPARAATSCEELVHLQLPDTTITSAQAIPAGDFAASAKLTLKGMPAFCRVVASVRAAPDSDIGVEIWLPKEGWNGVFHGNGNGGFGGILRAGYGGMEIGVKRGYASATTDMGTAPAQIVDGDPLIGHPQKWKDWGLLSTHVMTVAGKQITAAYYGTEIKRSYFTGCSSGGQQALIEAQVYPADYDGILAGAPVINRTWGHAAAIWNYRAASSLPEHKFSSAKLALLHDAAVKMCAGKGSGLAGDPFIADPKACKFDPAVLLCKGAATDACLTQDEVAVARAFYSGPRSKRSGKPLYFGWLPGSEYGPPGWPFLETTANNEPAFDALFKWVFGAAWDWRSFDFDRDMPKVDAVLGSSVNGAAKADLRAFEARGGKIILYHGWSDSLVSPLQTIAFYEKAAGRSGGLAKAQRFSRLYMAPGVGHCGGGAGPNVFVGLHPSESDADMFTALTQWVETATAPSKIVATKYVDESPAKPIALQRPLCPFPKKAWYKGSGSTADAANFVCAAVKPKF